MAVIPIRNGMQCFECESQEISISEGDSNFEQDLQRIINSGGINFHVVYTCLDCGHEGYIIFHRGGVES